MLAWDHPLGLLATLLERSKSRETCAPMPYRVFGDKIYFVHFYNNAASSTPNSMAYNFTSIPFFSCLFFLTPACSLAGVGLILVGLTYVWLQAADLIEVWSKSLILLGSAATWVMVKKKCAKRQAQSCLSFSSFCFCYILKCIID